MKTAAILVCRNDDYKEDERILVCLKSMLKTFDEVWFVDWNSSEDKGPLLWKLREQIPHNKQIKHIVINPQSVKMLLGDDPKIQPCSMPIGANIALRRCNADWIVVTTIDIIPPSKEVLNGFLLKSNKNTFYTLSRRDVEISDLEEMGFDKWEEFRDKNNKISQPRFFPTKVTPNDDYSIFNCCGDFQLAHKNVWMDIKGFEEEMLYACFTDTNIQKKAVLNGFSLEPVFDIPLYHLSHKGMGNDGASPSKQHYNDAWDWVEWFEESKNTDTWGFSDIEIEFEVI
jgi:hypothetical protein